jgi:hypothetical protein
LHILVGVRRSATEPAHSLWTSETLRPTGVDGPYCHIRVAKVKDAYLVIGHAVLDEELPALLWTMSSFPIVHPTESRARALEANASALRHARQMSHIRVVAVELYHLD